MSLLCPCAVFMQSFWGSLFLFIRLQVDKNIIATLKMLFTFYYDIKILTIFASVKQLKEKWRKMLLTRYCLSLSKC